MEILNFRILTLFVVQLNVYLNAIYFDEGCYIGEAPLLQMAFVMDQTGTFFGNVGGGNFFEQFEKLAPRLMEEIEKDYPGTQFALTTHADWERDAKPEQRYSDAHRIPEGCYRRVTKFTTNRTRFQIELRAIKSLSSGYRENALPALAFTAADAELGWIRNGTTTDGKMARRVMVLITDRDSGNITEPGKRQDFRGDGTDTCSSSKPPDHKILKNVFEKYQMSIIALLALTTGSGDLVTIYQNHFTAIGSTIPYCGRTFALKQNGRIWTNITSVKQIPKDFWANQHKMYELEEESEKASVGESPSPNKLKSAPNVKAGQFDNLIQFVKDCLRETKTEGCLFGDPEGFNTLGL